MIKMPNARKHHSDAGFVGDLDDLGVADGTAGLDDATRAQTHPCFFPPALS